jgi:hypothetical protein
LLGILRREGNLTLRRKCMNSDPPWAAHTSFPGLDSESAYVDSVWEDCGVQLCVRKED